MPAKNPVQHRENKFELSGVTGEVSRVWMLACLVGNFFFLSRLTSGSDGEWHSELTDRLCARLSFLSLWHSSGRNGTSSVASMRNFFALVYL